MFKKKILVELSGGLGNQLFNFSAGLAVCDLLKANLILDARRMDPGHDREVFFEIVNQQMIDRVLWGFGPNYNALVSQFKDFMRLRGISRISTRGHFIASDDLYRGRAIELGALIEDEVMKTNGKLRVIHISGFHKTFSNIQSITEKCNLKFYYQAILNSVAQKKLEEIRSTRKRRLLVLHVRRGDFVNLGVRGPGVLDKAYYESALQDLRGKLRNESVDAKVIEQTDSAGCNLEELIASYGFNFIERTERHKQSTKEDFLEIASCDFLISSNSTFSMWGAYLNPSSADIYIPDPIYRAEGGDKVSGVPEKWKKIQSHFS